MFDFIKMLGNIVFILIELFCLYLCAVGVEMFRNDIEILGLFSFVALFVVRMVICNALRSRTKTKLWIRRW